MQARAFVPLFIGTAAAMLGIGIIVPILPLYAESMGASGLLVGLVVGAFALSRTVFAPIIGRISDRRGRKRILLGGLFLYVLLSLSYVMAPDPAWLVAVRFAHGFASIMITPIAQAYIGDITPQGKEGEYINLFVMSLFTGMAIGPLLGGYLSEAFSFQAPFYAMAIAAGVSLLLVLVLVPDKAPTEAANRPATEHTFKAVLKDPPMRAIMSFMASRGFYRWGFNSFFPVLAIGMMSKTHIGLIVSGYMIIDMLFQYPMGRLSDTLSNHRTAFVLAGGSISALCMVAVPLAESTYLLLIPVFGMGTFSAVARSSMLAIRTERGRDLGMGTVTGAHTSSLGIGQMLGPILFGTIVDLFSLRAAFYVGGAAGLIGVLAALKFLRQRT